eukprot:14591-Heterococcus_DN1.PRE.1
MSCRFRQLMTDDSIEPTDHQQRNQLTITKLPRDWNAEDCDTSRHLRQASALDSASSVLSVVMKNNTFKQQQAIKRIDSSLEAIFRERTENERLAEQAAKETLEALRSINKCRGAPREDSMNKKAVLSDKLQFRESDVNSSNNIVNSCCTAAKAAPKLIVYYGASFDPADGLFLKRHGSKVFSPFILHPQSWFHVKWTMVILLLTLITAFITPVDVAWYSSKVEAVIYDRSSAFIEILNLMISAFFAVDIVVSVCAHVRAATASCKLVSRCVYPVQHCYHTRRRSLYQDPERDSKRVLTVLVLGRFAGYYTVGVVCHCKGHWPAATVQAAQDWPSIIVRAYCSTSPQACAERGGKLLHYNIIGSAAELAQYLTSRHVLQLYESEHTVQYDNIALARVSCCYCYCCCHLSHSCCCCYCAQLCSTVVVYTVMMPTATATVTAGPVYIASSSTLKM